MRRKYPPARHLVGPRLRAGDHDLTAVPPGRTATPANSARAGSVVDKLLKHLDVPNGDRGARHRGGHALPRAAGRPWPARALRSSAAAARPTPRLSAATHEIATMLEKILADAKIKDLQKDVQEPGQQLTTNQGLPVEDDNNQLRAGIRGPSLIEDLYFREKMNHFDHERIPERVVHARGAARPRVLRMHPPDGRVHPGRAVRQPWASGRRSSPGSAPSPAAAGQPGHAAGRAGVRRQVLHRRGRVGHGRERHAGLLHPGRDQVSRPDPRREAGAGQTRSRRPRAPTTRSTTSPA